ncbi:uncharacterized protein LOC122501416 [Leptopilina heterotoma]|uniref:uncharacterized protein LOC122501416 n=1 Tax=Leptopilina heterotoma TaxID=63436 RepID=UPI001CA93ED9|nr:uncharacterized protein LOC122501416 [Leptopilina heterotoma]
MRFAAVFLFLFAFYCDCNARNGYDLYSFVDAIRFCTRFVLRDGDVDFYNCRDYDYKDIGSLRIEFGKKYCIRFVETRDGTQYFCAKNRKEANMPVIVQDDDDESDD